MQVAEVAAAVVAVAVVDAKDGIQWRRWGGGIQWQRQRSTAASMDYG
jgi:hypothetical protein